MRNEKQLLLDEVKDQIEQYDSFVIMQYSALDSNATSNFRRQLASTGGEMEVVKKRILVKAAEAAGIELNLKTLPGHIALVFGGKDAIQTAKEVFDFRKSTDNAINVLGGRFDGRYYEAEDVEKLSKLPGKDEMRAQLLSVFEAPMAQTLSVMDALLCSVLFCLEQKSKQESSS